MDRTIKNIKGRLPHLDGPMLDIAIQIFIHQKKKEGITPSEDEIVAEFNGFDDKKLAELLLEVDKTILEEMEQAKKTPQ